MDNNILKKKLATYRSDKGRLKNVNDELLCELLCAWEQWPGTASKFYQSIGSTQRQMAKLIGKAKKLKREGFYPESNFKEIAIEDSNMAPIASGCNGAEVVWNDGKIIRFNDVNLLVDFLKKAA